MTDLKTIGIVVAIVGGVGGAFGLIEIRDAQKHPASNSSGTTSQ